MTRVRRKLVLTLEAIDLTVAVMNQSGSAKTSGEWARYKDEMDRLTAAVKHAMATPESEGDDTLHDADTKADAQTIKIAVNDSKSFRVPWDACRTWLVSKFSRHTALS